MHLIDQQLNLMIRGRFGEAWKLAEEKEKNDPNDPRSKFNRGWFCHGNSPGYGLRLTRDLH